MAKHRGVNLAHFFGCQDITQGCEVKGNCPQSRYLEFSLHKLQANLLAETRWLKNVCLWFQGCMKGRRMVIWVQVATLKDQIGSSLSTCLLTMLWCMLTAPLLPQIFWKMKDRNMYAWGHENVPKVLSPLEDIGVAKEFLDLELMSALFTL